MRTTKVIESNSRHSSYQKLPLYDANSLVAKCNNKMCLPSDKKGFVKVEDYKKKTSSGGYIPVAYGVAAVENISDVTAGDSSYSDYILYNYGAASERNRESSESGSNA